MSRNNSIEDERERLREIRQLIDSAEFDVWSVVKRAETTDPYIIMAKHRMNSSCRKRGLSGKKLPGRSRRLVSNMPPESDGGESSRSNTSANMNELEMTPQEFSFDDEDMRDTRASSRTCEGMYNKACNKFCVHPVAQFNKMLKTDKCVLRHRNMTEDDVKAIAVALVDNCTIETLDLSDNAMGPRGAQYIADTLKENTFIKKLYLASNKLTVLGVKFIVDVVVEEDNIQSLSLADNGLRECDCDIIRPLFENTFYLRNLDLSRNELREAGGEVIGHALKTNETLDVLDLSWNHLRRDGACHIANGLAVNTRLKKLNIAWNGFHMDGCRALAKALEKNTTLQELDIACNRISKECLEKLLVGLRKNETIETLRIGKNPITPAGAMLLLEFLRDNKNTGITELDLTDQLVKPAFVDLLVEMKASNDIKVMYGQVLGHDKRGDEDEITLMDENPIIVLMEYGKLMGFRLLDLFAVFDKDGSKTLDHDEIRTGLRLVNIPLSDECIEILIRKLDTDGDGEIDFGELLAAQVEHRKEMCRFYAAQDKDIDVEQTEVGRIRIKLSRLMAKKMSGNPAFKRGVENMKRVIDQQGEVQFAAKMGESIAQRMRGNVVKTVEKDKDVFQRSKSVTQLTLTDKIKQWKPMN